MSVPETPASEIASLLRARPGIDLAGVDTSATPGFDGDKAAGEEALAAGAEELADLQEQLFAASRSGGDTRRVLLVLQAMDTAGKGGIVKHVVGSVDPQGVVRHREVVEDARNEPNYQKINDVLASL